MSFDTTEARDVQEATDAAQESPGAKPLAQQERRRCKAEMSTIHRQINGPSQLPLS
ncbi:MAG: hypothetical protein HZY76_00290 [Anaerolineae bacterium]|nr:MAG: hypothetical protein HZY76_00290 [Anaerolineae bacterium]